MSMSKRELWERFQKYCTEFPTLGLTIDLSRVSFPEDLYTQKKPDLDRAFQGMKELEAGAIANPDENRMVGHYWLRNPALSPTPSIRAEIESTLEAIKNFAREVHTGAVVGAGGPFKNLLVIGVGGSALGPQFVATALGHPLTDRMNVFFFDNTDPDGMDKTLARIAAQLGQTLCVVISKSGGTPETRNGMLEAEAAYARAGLRLGAHAVAVTQEGSAMHRYATSSKWIRCFPMWDWVGGRTSEMSAVGLLPAALQGIDIDGMIAGAKACDEVTRQADVTANPAAQLALMWHHIGQGKGAKDMVVIPYKDRLELFSRYLQQLIMESLGKEKDLQNRTVNQGIAVYGNKGSTDQHAYVQQLREGLDNFFLTFVEVLRDRRGTSLEVEPGVTAGDYLSGFYLGTREALFENSRQSITLTIPEVTPFAVGMLIALFERAVGLYATMININAYHQPGVQAGKKAADAILKLQLRVVQYLAERLSLGKKGGMTVMEIADALGAPDSAEAIYKILEHLAANPGRKIQKESGSSPGSARYLAC